MSNDKVVRLVAANEENKGGSKTDTQERRLSARDRAAMARRTERNAVIGMIARHVPAAAALYFAAYALPELDLIAREHATFASWGFLAIAGLLYFRISYTGWIGPLFFALVASAAVYAMKEGIVAVDDVWLTRARDVLTFCIATFIASILTLLFGKR